MLSPTGTKVHIGIEASARSDTPHVVSGCCIDAHEAVGGKKIDIVCLITEGMEGVSIIIGYSIPGTEPHQAVGCLGYAGNRVGGKSVDDGEFANIAVGESHNLQ